MYWKTCNAVLLCLVVLVLFSLSSCDDLFSGSNDDDSEQTEYLIVFLANGGEGVMNDQTVSLNQSVTLNANQFVMDGYDFIGWSTAEDGDVEYGDEGTYTHTEQSDVTLYAQWEARIDETDTDSADEDDTETDDADIAISNPDEPVLAIEGESVLVRPAKHTFTVTAGEGIEISSYQWRINGETIAGATEASLEIDSGDTDLFPDPGQYTLTVLVVIDGKPYSTQFAFVVVE